MGGNYPDGALNDKNAPWFEVDDDNFFIPKETGTYLIKERFLREYKMYMEQGQKYFIGKSDAWFVDKDEDNN